MKPAAPGLLVALAVLLIPAMASARPVLPPGQEALFASLLGDPPEGWTIEAIQIEGDHVDYTLSRDSARARVRLRHPAAEDPSAISRTTRGDERGFLVEVESAGGTSDDALEAILEHVTARLAGSEANPWIEASGSEARATPHGTQEEPARGAPRAQVYGALALALALAFFLAAGVAHRRSRPALPLVVAGLAIALVVRWGWVADDAFITFRYLDQAIHGHGLVFNRGERVQGFTHPLWVLLVLGPAALVGPLDATLFTCIACSVGLLLLLLQIARARMLPPIASVGILIVLFTCEPFVAFQTGALENALAHLLLAASLLASFRIASLRTASPSVDASRAPSFFAAALCLLLLTRLDLVLFALPLVWRVRRDLGGTRAMLRAGHWGWAFGATSLLGWFAFATLYYGFPLPNTFYAKTGEALPIARGFAYLLDFVLHEPLAAAILGGGLAVAPRVHPTLRAGVIGAGLYLLYGIVVGGDYMRGRFLVAPLLLSALALAEAASTLSPARLRGAVACTFVLGALGMAFGNREGAGGIVNERAFHPESQLFQFVEGEARPNPIAGALIPNPTLGASVMARAYADDPRLIWIDAHGLTDAFVARCPPRREGRAGHVLRRIPLAYFQSRGDLRLLDEGEERMRRRDPSLADEVRDLRQSAHWDPRTLAHRDAIRLLTRGPLFAPGRMATVLRYTFTRATVPVPSDTPIHQPPP